MEFWRLLNTCYPGISVVCNGLLSVTQFFSSMLLFQVFEFAVSSVWKDLSMLASHEVKFHLDFHHLIGGSFPALKLTTVCRLCPSLCVVIISWSVNFHPVLSQYHSLGLPIYLLFSYLLVFMYVHFSSQSRKVNNRVGGKLLGFFDVLN